MHEQLEASQSEAEPADAAVALAAVIELREQVHEAWGAVRLLTDCLVETRDDLAALKARHEATDAVAWLVLSSSAQAVEKLRREQPNFRQFMRDQGLSVERAEAAASHMELMLATAEKEPRVGSTEWVRGLGSAAITELDAMLRPSQWTWGGLLLAAVAAACCLVLSI